MCDILKGTEINDRYIVEETLGIGGYGSVFLVIDKNDNKNKKALKKIITNNAEDYENEIKILLNFKDNLSEHVMKYYEYFVWDFSNVIVTEYYENGDLGQRIEEFKSNKRNISDDKFELWIKQMIIGLYDLHQKNIIHKNLKPPNIFITKKEDIVIGDLGVEKYNETLNKKTAGTINYMSPEMISGKTIDKKTDMWSLGCIVYELEKLEKLFNGSTDDEIMNQILTKEIVELKIKNNNIETLFKECLRKDIKERIDSKDGYDLIVNKSNNQKSEKFLRVIEASSNYIWCLAELSNGDLVSGSSENKICIWNVKSGECSKVLEGHTSGVNCLVVLSTGELASASSDKTIRIWNTETRKCLKILEENSNYIWCLVELPNGDLVSGSSDNKIRIWNVKKGEFLKVLEGHTSAVNCLKVLSTGELVSGSSDKTIRVWDTETGKSLKILKAHSNRVVRLTILLTDELVSGSFKEIRIWNLKTEECLRVLKGHDSFISGLTVLPTGELVSSSFDKTVRVWNAMEKECLNVLEGHLAEVWSLAVLSTGEIISGSFKEIRIWSKI